MSKKLDLLEVIDRVRKMHGPHLVIDGSTFLHGTAPARFVDTEYGEFWNKPCYVINEKEGHPARGREKTRVASIKPLEEIIKEIEKVHKSTVFIDGTTYISKTTIARFIDIHKGDFWQTPDLVIRGCRHPEYKSESVSRRYKLSIDEVKTKIFAAHGNVVSLDESTYKNSSIKAIFIDKEYGIWSAMPSSVWNGHGHPKRASVLNSSRLTIDPRDIQRRVHDIHNGKFLLDFRTYKNVMTKCDWFDLDYGIFQARPNDLLNGQSNKFRKLGKTKNTNLKKYGKENTSQVGEIYDKIMKSCNAMKYLPYWKTDQLVPCRGGYEAKLVEYFNKNQIEFEWQNTIKKGTVGGAFPIPKEVPLVGGRVYYMDFYLPASDLYIQVKGRFWPDKKLGFSIDKAKWEWFHRTYPNSELWDRKKLSELGILPKYPRYKTKT